MRRRSGGCPRRKPVCSPRRHRETGETGDRNRGLSPVSKRHRDVTASRRRSWQCRRLPAPVDQVREREERVSPQHARPRVAHHDADLLAHGRGVAVHLAVRARGFVVAEDATIEAAGRMVRQAPAFGAKLAPRSSPGPVLVPAVDARHRVEGGEFACQTRVMSAVVGAARRGSRDRSCCLGVHHAAKLARGAESGP